MRNYSRDNIRACPSLTLARTLSGDKSGVGRGLKEGEVRVGSYKYDSKEQLGKGYSSHVFKGCEVDNPHKRVAVKVIDLKKFKGASLEMLEGEIEIHSSLEHPNIVRLLEVVKTPHSYYLVMEYCPHGNLREYITQKKQLTQTNAIEIVNQLLAAYRHLLDQGVVHRDIKPANVLRMGNRWKISDFGFAVRSRFGFKDRMNVGTPLYMAPQSLKKSYYSYKSDIYSIGILLYEMLVGDTPNEAETEKELLDNIGREVILPKPVRNTRLADFVSRACLTSEAKRMGKDQLMGFEFGQAPLGQLTRSLNSSTLSIKERNLSGTTQDSLSKQKSDSSSKLLPRESKQALERTGSNRSGISVRGSSDKGRPNPMLVNKELQLSELVYVELLHGAIQNQESFELQEEQRRVLMLTLFKLLLKVVRLLCDKGENHFRLSHWEEYQQCKLHQELYATFTQRSETYEKEYLDFIRHNDIRVIRAVNRKFPELSHSAPLTARFYQQLQHFMAQVLKEHYSKLLFLASKGEKDLQDRHEALYAALCIYRLAETRSMVPQGLPSEERPSCVQDYSESKRSKVEVTNLYRQVKAL